MYHRLLLLGIFMIGFLLSGCEMEKKKIRLGLKFHENQTLSWKTEIRNSIESYENDSLVYSGDKNITYQTFEEVVEIIDSVSARLRLVQQREELIPDKNDTTGKVAIERSSSVEYIQNFRGETIDIFLDDADDDVIKYYKNLYEQWGTKYPDHPVSEGYSWSNTVRILLKDEGLTDATTTYHIRAFVREAGYDCAVIEYKGNSIIPYRKKCKETNQMFVRLDKRSAEGVYYLAYRKGFVIRLEENFDYEGTGTKYVKGKKINFKVKEKGTYSYYLTGVEGI